MMPDVADGEGALGRGREGQVMGAVVFGGKGLVTLAHRHLRIDILLGRVAGHDDCTKTIEVLRLHIRVWNGEDRDREGVSNLDAYLGARPVSSDGLEVMA